MEHTFIRRYRWGSYSSVTPAQDVTLDILLHGHFSAVQSLMLVKTELESIESPTLPYLPNRTHQSKKEAFGAMFWRHGVATQLSLALKA